MVAISGALMALRSTSRTGGFLRSCSPRIRALSSQMTLNDFANFHVPQSLIAQAPANPRDSSRLMVDFRVQCLPIVTFHTLLSRELICSFRMKSLL